MAPNRDAALQKCFVCGGATGNGWCCRIPRAGGQIVFCSPTCLIKYCEEATGQAAKKQEFEVYA